MNHPATIACWQSRKKRYLQYQFSWEISWVLLEVISVSFVRELKWGFSWQAYRKWHWNAWWIGWPARPHTCILNENEWPPILCRTIPRTWSPFFWAWNLWPIPLQMYRYNNHAASYGYVFFYFSREDTWHRTAAVKAHIENWHWKPRFKKILCSVMTI